MTGTQLYKYLQQKVGHPYTGYLDTTKANRLLKEALINVIESKYRSLIEQKQFDEITSLIKTEKVFTPDNNIIYLYPLQISGITFDIPSGLVTITVDTIKPHLLSTGDIITTLGISGILSNPTTVINGTHTVTVVNSAQFTYTATATLLFGVYITGSGYVVATKYISDYWHLLTVKSLFEKDIFCNPLNFSNTNPIIAEIKERNNLRTCEKVLITGVIGNTAANTTAYLKKINTYKFELYSDKDLQNKISGNGDYVSGGKISRIYYNYCKIQRSHQKIGIFNTADIENPKAEITENLLKITPSDEICKEITIDYIKTPSVIIDTTDNSTELMVYYTEKLLYYIIDEAARLYGEQVKDKELVNISSTEQTINQ